MTTRLISGSISAKDGGFPAAASSLRTIAAMTETSSGLFRNAAFRSAASV
jgi:hypothetical protein